MSSSSSSRSRSPRKNKKRVYVTGYSLKEDQHDIKKLFKKFGKIEEFAWKGKYCFIEFKDPEDAEKAVKKMNKEEVKGSVLQVEMARGNKPSKNNGLCYSCGHSGHLQVLYQYDIFYIYSFTYFDSAKNCRHRSSSSSSSSSSSESRKKHKKKHKKKKSSSSSDSSSSSSSRDKKKKLNKKRKSSKRKSKSSSRGSSKDSHNSESSGSVEGEKQESNNIKEDKQPQVEENQGKGADGKQ